MDQQIHNQLQHHIALQPQQQMQHHQLQQQLQQPQHEQQLLALAEAELQRQLQRNVTPQEQRQVHQQAQVQLQQQLQQMQVQAQTQAHEQLEVNKLQAHALGILAQQPPQSSQALQQTFALQQPPLLPPAGPQQGLTGSKSRTFPSSVAVSACANPTMTAIIMGVYEAHDFNHGKLVYKRETGVPGSLVYIYYWDDRDGASFEGWWIGPEIGGDQIWCKSEEKNLEIPPCSGWKVPWDGPVDHSLMITPSEGTQNLEDAARQNSLIELQRKHEQLQQQQQQLLQKQQEEENDRQQKSLAFQAQQLQYHEQYQRQNEEAQQREIDMLERQSQLNRLRVREETRRLERAAELVVRKAIRRVRAATPENYDYLVGQLTSSLNHHSERLGASAEQYRKQAEETIQATRVKLEQALEERQHEEHNKLEAEIKRKVEVERIGMIVQEATIEVQAAIASAVEKVADSLSALEGQNNGAALLTMPETMMTIADGIKENCDAVHRELDVLSASLTDKRASIGVSSEAKERLRTDFYRLYGELAVARRKVEGAEEEAAKYKEQAQRKATAMKVEKDLQDFFLRYDVDGDGKLSSEEVIVCAREEFGFELSEKASEKIFNHLGVDGFIGLEHFQRLKSMLPLAKSEAQAKEKSDMEQAKNKEADEQRARLESVVTDGNNCVNEIQDLLSKARKLVEPILGRSSDVTEIDDENAATLVTAEAGIAPVTEQLKLMSDLIGEAEGMELTEESSLVLQKQEVQKLTARNSAAQAAHARLLADFKSLQELRGKRETEVCEAIRSQVAIVARDHAAKEGTTVEELYDRTVATQESPDRLDQAAFLRLVRSFTAETEAAKLEDSQLERLFKAVLPTRPRGGIAEDADAPPGLDTVGQTLDRERFVWAMRASYRCVRASLLTESLAIKSKPVRRLEDKEVLEAIEGPLHEESAGLQRVHCRAMRDGATGWVTVSGNHGSVFLKPGGNLFTCVKQTPLLDRRPGTENATTIRQLATGEIVEALEFASCATPEDTFRIRGVARLDGATGWLDVIGCLEAF